ncbi:MAG: NAD(P)H-dependent oxidoreductase, partial [Peptococcaceae bacterium]|nr:NAD(P)H-dependent oxidoreductase [Peptococcaceae bacterium]
MRILVLNGSPKGEYSVTLQTSLYLQKRYPQHDFEVLHVGQRIKLLERDFTPILEAVEKADLLLFSYPVYTFIAPSQLHRFIELLKASGIDLRGKYATQITTSKHFYDVTAHRYIQDNCQDMGLKYIRGLSADMDDLLTEQGQKEAGDFLQYVTWCVAEDVYEPFPASAKEANCVPVEVPAESVQPKQPGDVVIITDCEEDNTQLRNMIARFQSKLGISSRVVNIREYPIKGGCLGCFNCAVSGKCIYTDGFDAFLRNHIQTADAMVFAFRIKDHSMGAVFKQYNDREFCNGHRT